MKDKLREAQARDGPCLLRGLRAGDAAGPLWEQYMELSEIEAAFKTLKSDLDLRPIRHHGERRIEAHVLGCFLAHCLSVTLRKRLAAHPPRRRCVTRHEVKNVVETSAARRAVISIACQSAHP